MDAVQKLSLFGEQMELEPAEEVGRQGSPPSHIPLKMARGSGAGDARATSA